MKILLICAGGMSTGLLVEAMLNAANQQKIDIKVQSAPSESLEENVKNFDVFLVGPQIRHRFDRLKEIVEKYQKPIAVIDNKVYGLVDGKGALEQAVKLYKKVNSQ